MNEYDFEATHDDLAKLECIVGFPPTGLQLSDVVVIKIDNGNIQSSNLSNFSIPVPVSKCDML